MGFFVYTFVSCTELLSPMKPCQYAFLYQTLPFNAHSEQRQDFSTVRKIMSITVIRVPVNFNPFESGHLHDLLQGVAGHQTRLLHRAHHLSRHEFKVLGIRSVEAEPWFRPNLEVDQIHPLLRSEDKSLVLALPSNDSIFGTLRHGRFKLRPLHVIGNFASYQTE